MADDWDLHAVVRGCAAITTAKNFTPFQQDSTFTTPFQDLYKPRNRIGNQELLNDLYKPFYKPKDSSPAPPEAAPEVELPRKPQAFSVSDVSKVNNNSTPRFKRRKNHLKRVCHVAAENLSSDMWSWRKYGQKPIKGSPYPRGYYRCSTSKACMARKQVERNRSDPGMFIVTYTAEHNHPMPTHRNSLAGSTRQKPAENSTPEDPGKPALSPETSAAASLSPATEKLEDDEDDVGESKMEELDDDFFVGLEEFMATDCSTGHFPGSLPFPWLSSATTIAGEG